jgi:hypothetical protein
MHKENNMIENRDRMIAFCIRAEEALPDTSRSFIKVISGFLATLTLPELQEHVVRAEQILNVPFTPINDIQINTIQNIYTCRTTEKNITVADLVTGKWDWDNNEIIDALGLLMHNGHYLPTVTLSRNDDGTYTILSHKKMVNALSVLVALTEEANKKRKILQYKVPVIIIEPSKDTDVLIKAYKTIGV